MTIPREVRYAQQDMSEAIEENGEAVAFRHRYNIHDFENGNTTRCSCYEATKYYGQASLECPLCFGTTFTDGYALPLVVPAILNEGNPEVTQDKRGLVIKEKLQCYVVNAPLLEVGDLFARLKRSPAGDFEVDDLFRVTNFKRITLRIAGHDINECLVGQSFSIARVGDSDVVRGLSFL